MTSSGGNPVGGMFGRIAGVYDLLNHLLSLGIDRHWRRELALLARPEHDGDILDLAAGTLDVAVELARNDDANISALDFCMPMLARGIIKLEKRGLEKRILPVCGDALAVPFPADNFASVTMAFGIRNIPDRPASFREMLRVLKPGGKACILEFGSGKERIWGGIYNFYLANLLPRIGQIIGNDKKAYDYLAATIRNFPNAAALEREMRDAGFIETGWRKLTSGIVCLHWGHKPE